MAVADWERLATLAYHEAARLSMHDLTDLAAEVRALGDKCDFRARSLAEGYVRP